MHLTVYLYKFSFSSAGRKRKLGLYILHRISENTDIFKATAKIKKMMHKLELPKRTEEDAGNISLGVMNPEKYGTEILLSIQDHISITTKEIMTAAQIKVEGLENAVHVIQAGKKGLMYLSIIN